jgi:MoaA/NifB/PqqE/SkfB family radical SAM enzyme
MARVLLVHPPVSVARDYVDYPYFSDLGAVQLAGVLGAAGHEVQLVDAYALPGSTLVERADGRLHLGASIEEVVAAVRGDVDRVVVAYTPFLRPPARDDLLAALLGDLRRVCAGAPIILADLYQSGQHYVEADGVLASHPEADAWLKYEAEESLLALVDGEPPRGVYRGHEPGDLDALPLPAWHLVDLEAYDRFRARVVERGGRGRWAFPIDGRTLPMVTSRGCPFTCVHCSSNPGRPDGAAKLQRRLSPARLRQHLQALVRTHGATRIEVLDELINVNERHFDAFLDEIEALDVRFDVPNGMRADYLEPRHFERMRSRVTTVSVSAESGVQRVVTEVVKKRLDLAAIERAARAAHEARVPLLIHFLIGLPGESAAEVNGTLSFAISLHDRFGAEPAVQYATPLPGTPLARGRALPVVGDWGPCFQGTPTQPDSTVPAADLRRFKWTFDERLRASRAPQRLVLGVTYACNNRCSFCCVDTRAEAHGSGTRQREELDHHRRLGVTVVEFDGGEPTLHPELIPLVAHARAIGYERVTVTTNGRRCFYADYARQLVRSGVTHLRFSVHGPDAQLHGQHVDVPEAFEQTLAGIRHCVAAAPDAVELGMNVTVTRDNQGHLDALARLALDLGLRSLDLHFLTPFGRGTRALAPDLELAAASTRRLIDEHGGRLQIRVLNLPFCFMPGYEACLVGDLGKVERHTIFAGDEDASLARYHAALRRPEPVCASCPHAIFCGGFYDLGDAPEPPWRLRLDRQAPLADRPSRPID